MFRREGSIRSAARPDSRGAATGHAVGQGDPLNLSSRASTSNAPPETAEKPVHDTHHLGLPLHHGKKKRTKGIKEDGESGRSGFHPFHFLSICFRSSCTLSMVVNVLWPLVPAAIAVHFIYHGDSVNHGHHVLVFTLNYLALIPCANLIGFAGQELARKLPKVAGVLLENFVGSVTELILFIALTVMAVKGLFATGFAVIKAAIMGSILANLLLCLGACFIAGGFNRHEQAFHEIMSETGSGLMLVAGIALVAPTIFSTILRSPDGLGSAVQDSAGLLPTREQEERVLDISYATAVLLLVAFAIYLIFQTTSHHSLYDDVFEQDEQNDRDRHKDLAKAKLTLTECVVALLIGVAGVALTAVFLVLEIDFIVEENHVSDAFMGLILVPLVEKAAEHLTAVDEAYDNQPNLVLAHILGGSIQTALLNAPIVVIIAWAWSGPGHKECALLDLNFRPFEAIMLILAIIVVGNFLRDGKSNYLEGSLLVLVYVIIAVCAFYIPNDETGGNRSYCAIEGQAEAESSGEAAQHAVAHVVRAVLG